MYKVELHYNFMSPTLQVVSGTLRIGKIDFGMLPGYDSEYNEQECTFKKEQGMLEYKNCPSMFARAKPISDIMIRSYFDGMLLRELGVTWFKDCYRKNNDVFITIPD
jgi:hypothetical protein